MGQAIPSNAGAKFSVLTRGLFSERLDGAILRLTSPITEDHPEEAAEAQMADFLRDALPEIERFIPGE
jgi:hypothetical protein